MAILLDGKKVAQEIAEHLKKEVAKFQAQSGKKFVLAPVVIGDNAASSVYIKSQAKVASEFGITYRFTPLPGNVSEAAALAQIKKLGEDPSVGGIILQTPLPVGVDVNILRQAIPASKDAEGVTAHNLGMLVLGKGKIVPCTAAACLELLRFYQIKPYGKETVIIGHSEIVGKPLSLLLLKEFATTTVCHIATSEAKKLAEHVQQAEILIVAVGKPNLVKGDWIRDGAVVIDAGINRVNDTIVGDVEFESAQKRASYITPVPGGVGPLTVLMLMKNCIELFKEALENR